MKQAHVNWVFVVYLEITVRGSCSDSVVMRMNTTLAEDDDEDGGSSKSLRNAFQMSVLKRWQPSTMNTLYLA